MPYENAAGGSLVNDGGDQASVLINQNVTAAAAYEAREDYQLKYLYLAYQLKAEGVISHATSTPRLSLAAW